MNTEPTAAEAAAYVGVTLAEYMAYAIILLGPLAFWIMTP